MEFKGAYGALGSHMEHKGALNISNLTKFFDQLNSLTVFFNRFTIFTENFKVSKSYKFMFNLKGEVGDIFILKF
jgi:hypothetical protein